MTCSKRLTAAARIQLLRKLTFDEFKELNEVEDWLSDAELSQWIREKELKKQLTTEEMKKWRELSTWMTPVELEEWVLLKDWYTLEELQAWLLEKEARSLLTEEQLEIRSATKHLHAVNHFRNWAQLSQLKRRLSLEELKIWLRYPIRITKEEMGSWIYQRVRLPEAEALNWLIERELQKRAGGKHLDEWLELKEWLMYEEKSKWLKLNPKTNRSLQEDDQWNQTVGWIIEEKTNGWLDEIHRGKPFFHPILFQNL